MQAAGFQKSAPLLYKFAVDGQAGIRNLLSTLSDRHIVSFEGGLAPCPVKPVNPLPSLRSLSGDYGHGRGTPAS